ncbi:MAG: adenosylcobinamide-phosphate synthase, partial [bacterium]|nr:adenosylcobinamide-phosphate synthase [bacterium]
AYKAVNTLDSMVGYKNEKYLYFGRAGARMDDVSNLIPARLSTLLIPAASLFCFTNGARAFVTAWRDGLKHSSPNAGYPEAAIAGALGVQLGGTNYYHGRESVKPLIGKPIEQLRPGHISKSVLIAYITALLAVLSGIAIVLS